jgi:hypothetical protein
MQDFLRWRREFYLNGAWARVVFGFSGTLFRSGHAPSSKAIELDLQSKRRAEASGRAYEKHVKEPICSKLMYI